MQAAFFIYDYGAKYKKICKLFSFNTNNSLNYNDNTNKGQNLAKEIGANFDISLNSDSNLTSSYSEDYLYDYDIETKINQSVSKLSSSNVLSNQLTEGNVHIVSQSNYSKYFDRNGNPLPKDDDAKVEEAK